MFRVTVEANDVLAYCNGSYREEEEFIVLLPESARPIRATRPRPPPPPPGPLRADLLVDEGGESVTL